jgi:hypothetical protein
MQGLHFELIVSALSAYPRFSQFRCCRRHQPQMDRFAVIICVEQGSVIGEGEFSALFSFVPFPFRRRHWHRVAAARTLERIGA